MISKETRTELTLGRESVRSPRLNELKTRKCSCEEIQAALVHVIELYNQSGSKIEKALHKII